MTMLPPFLPQSIRYGSGAFPDVEPFSMRSAASYEDIQYGIVVWIRDQLMPWIADNSAGTTWATMAQALTDSVNAALAAEAADYASRYGKFFQGVLVAPPPTGVTATDTANLQSAFATANSRHADLVLSPSTDGTVRAYSLSAPLTWNLNRGSLIGQGHIALDFSQVPSTYQGAALMVTTNTDGTEGSHLSATHRLEHFVMLGHNTDASLMDGLYFMEGAAGMGNDQGTVDAVQVIGFHDSLTFGPDVWDIEFRKCSFSNAHRYNLNLSYAGENMQFLDCDIYGANNASGTAANLHVPGGQSIDVHIIGGSLDYPGGSGGPVGGVQGTGGSGGIQGIIEGGCVTFDKVHIEDSNTGPMFTYNLQTAGSWIDVTFRDCYWASTVNSGQVRDHLHEIMPTTRDGITIRFEGDKGAANGTTLRWIQDNSGLTTGGVSVTYDNWNVMNNGATPTSALLLAPFQTLGVNMRFDTSNAFVSGGILGWTAGSVGAWSIGPSNARSGNCLSFVGDGTTGTNQTYQRMRISAGRRPLRISGYQQVTAYTGGSVGLYARFYAEDGVTQVGIDSRIATDLTGLASWTGKSRRITPPNGAAFVQVFANAGNFQGTAQWDDIEVVPL